MEEFIKRFWNYVVSQNKDNLKKHFYKDAIIIWHCTNEEFNLEEYIIANCEYPGEWECEIERIIKGEKDIIIVTRVYSGNISFHATSFFKMKNDKIKELDEYFGEDGIAPKWRRDKRLGNAIK